jgi:predicted nucleic acid-binding protein
MAVRRTIYFDTSALAKWYLNESLSEKVEEYIRENGPVAVSDLTVVEMRCLLARRRRERNFDAKTEMRVFAAFEEDIRQRFLILHPMPESLAAGAVHLIASLPDVPLRTLDAMHLVVAESLDTDILATSDRIMADGAEKRGLKVARFFRGKEIGP